MEKPLIKPNWRMRSNNNRRNDRAYIKMLYKLLEQKGKMDFADDILPSGREWSSNDRTSLKKEVGQLYWF